jgi:hypothetical protein
MMERIVLSLLGLVNLTQAFTLHAAFRYVNFTAGILLILLAIFYRRLYRSNRVSFDDNSIECNMGGPKFSRIPWENVSSIEPDMPFFRISTKDGDTISLDLSDITYRQHELLIPDIIAFARTKGITVKSKPEVQPSASKRTSSRKQKR